jgi:methyl-accepting chemotaxis protein
MSEHTPVSSEVWLAQIRDLSRLFNDRSLRTKLILAFLAITLLSVGGVALFSSRATQDALTREVGANLHSLADSRARALGDLIDRQVDLLEAFALSKLIQDAAAVVSAGYRGDPATIRAGIEQLDRRWVAAQDDDVMIQAHLSNLYASELKEYQDTFPDQAEVFLTDKYGALVAASERTSGYDHSDEDWWRAAYNNGQGAAFIGQPQFDQSRKVISVVIALPMYVHGTHEVVGVLHTTYNLNPLAQMLATTRFGQTGQNELLLSDGRLFDAEGNLAAVDAAELAQLKQSAGAEYAQIALSGTPRLVSQAPVVTHDSEHAALVAGLGWTLVVHQDSDEAFQPVSAALRSTLFAGLAALLGAGLLAFVVAQAISAPIKRLTLVALQIASGDLSRRVMMRQRDEIGRLAVGFNTMADALETRIAAEQHAQAEARRLQQAEADGRLLLEHTVADYLSFVERVAQGDLTQRLTIQRNGALGQLGQGLNGMVENLQRITAEVQQATNAIAAAAAEILAATNQQAASAAEQSAAITQTTTTVDEVKAIASQTAERANQVAQDSQAALSVARQGAGVVEETVAGMNQIRARVESIASTILALAEQTQAIGTIISTVSELADQSNLLALNAAIESARAGEAGKSFAVVAQHVRALAERSKGATVQVKEILSEIQKATQVAVLVTEEGTKGVDAGGKLAASAGVVIHKIAREVESGAQASVQIAAAATQQTAGMEQIGQAMVSIQQATTQALSSTRQAERAAQDLHTLSQSLQQAISAYRLYGKAQN